MKIGIKYCGGCNTYYDRVKAVEDIKAAFPDNEYLTVSDQDTYDEIFLVNGCVRRCTGGYRDAEAKEYIVFKSLEDFEEYKKRH